MKILGVDYGSRKVGIAIAEGPLASPHVVIRYPFGEKLAEIVKTEGIGKIVVGVSEGDVAKNAREFGEELSQTTGLPVEYEDETLSTYDAQKLSQAAGIKRSKRRAMEDAYSATLILQRYLDRQ